MIYVLVGFIVVELIFAFFFWFANEQLQKKIKEYLEELKKEQQKLCLEIEQLNALDKSTDKKLKKLKEFRNV